MAELRIGALLAGGAPAALVEVAEARGSTPREAGARMVVTADALAGTIGGGQLEFFASDSAREMLRAGEARRTLDVPLGPHLGQCCGGHVRLELSLIDPAARAALIASEAAREALRPHVYVFGLGHTGRALARCLALLPFSTHLVDDRADVFADLPQACARHHAPDPGEVLARAAPGAAFIILTHSHALDYRLADAALRRADAAYTGMIGSATKRARFEAHFLKSGGTRDMLARFTCPIGAGAAADKRPEVIAALTAAQIVGVFSRDAGSPSPALREKVARSAG